MRQKRQVQRARRGGESGASSASARAQQSVDIVMLPPQTQCENWITKRRHNSPSAQNKIIRNGHRPSSQ